MLLSHMLMFVATETLACLVCLKRMAKLG